MRIDLGGGLVPAPNHVNIDLIDEADIKWDLNKGLPHTEFIQDLGGGIKGKVKKDFPFREVEGIRASMILEHLTDIIPLMNDCFEVMKVGADFEISVPYAGTMQDYQDPTHVRHFVEATFDYFMEFSPYKKEQDQYGITSRFTVIKNERGWGTDAWQLLVTLRK